MPVFWKKQQQYPDEISAFPDDKKSAKNPAENKNTTPCSVFIEKEQKVKIEKAKATSTWVAFLMKLKFYFVQSVSTNSLLCGIHKTFCANRQSFIDAIVSHSRCLLELYFIAADFALVLALDMLIIALIGLGHIQVEIIFTILQLMGYLMVRIFASEEFQLDSTDDEPVGKFTPQLLAVRLHNEKKRIKLDVLRKQKMAKIVYNLLTITFAILLCSLATILVDILLLKRCSLMESFYEFPEVYECPLGLAVFLQLIIFVGNYIFLVFFFVNLVNDK